jgi:hypothetical protein
MLLKVHAHDVFTNRQHAGEREVRIPKSGYTSAVLSDSTRTALLPLTQQLAAAAHGQLHNVDIAALCQAFAAVKNALCSTQNVRAHVVRLDLEGLTKLFRSHKQMPVLEELPRGVWGLRNEVRVLFLNCCKVAALPEWFNELRVLEELYLDGRSSFVHKHVTKGKLHAELFHGRRRLHDLGVFYVNTGLPSLPPQLGLLPSLHTLSLVDMATLSGVRVALSQLSALTSLTIRKCPRLHTLPDLPDCIHLTKLVLAGVSLSRGVLWFGSL